MWSIIYLHPDWVFGVTDHLWPWILPSPPPSCSSHPVAAAIFAASPTAFLLNIISFSLPCPSPWASMHCCRWPLLHCFGLHPLILKIDRASPPAVLLLASPGFLARESTILPQQLLTASNPIPRKFPGHSDPLPKMNTHDALFDQLKPSFPILIKNSTTLRTNSQLIPFPF
jgi:hypothetical protein